MLIESVSASTFEIADTLPYLFSAVILSANVSFTLNALRSREPGAGNESGRDTWVLQFMHTHLYVYVTPPPEVGHLSLQ